MTAQFKDYKLRLVNPDFDSPLIDHIVDLEKLRRKRVENPVPKSVFNQLKEFFHDLESLESARIEGNNTTVSELVERKISGESNGSDKQRELENTKRALDYIEATIKGGSQLSQSFIFELHQLVVDKLSREGSQTPGMLRNKDVNITRSNHKPPPYMIVRDYFDELVEFINNDDKGKKYNLLITALAHHRFAWIHPFDNGNGRVVRLLTYAMLIKQNFHLEGRIINPTAVFCIDREKYYEMLSAGDQGTDEGLLVWCEYVLEGLLSEINKIDRLSDRDYLVYNILVPALNYCIDRQNITKEEYTILKLSVTKKEMEIAAADVKKVFPSKHGPQTTRKINSLRDKKMLKPVKEGGRKYTISFEDNYLLRGVKEFLQKESFIGIPD